jgi:hypothetical protein
MRYKFTILLVILNLGLFSLIFYLEKQAATIGAFERAKRLVFPPGFVEDSDHLEIEGRELTQNWTLVRKMDQWFLDSPINWPANIYAVSRMINQLKFLEWETRFSVSEIKKAGRSLADYGLEEPKAILSLSYGDKKKELKIGESTEIGKRLYILSPAEEEVYVVNRELLQSITVDLQDLRSQNIFDIPLFEVRSISIQITGPSNLKVRLARNDKNWVFESPIQTEADSQRVMNTINRLTGLKVIDFQGTDRVQEISTNPSLRITLEGNNRRQTLLVGEELTENERKIYFAKMEGNPTVFTLAAAPINDLRDVQESLRDKSIIDINPLELTSIEIMMSDTSVELQKLETGTWQVLQSNNTGDLSTWTADLQLLNEVIIALHEMEAVQFISDAPSAADLEKYGFNDPQRRVVLQTQDKLTLLIGDMDPESKLLFAKMINSPTIYKIKKDILHLLKTRALYYRLRVLEELPQGARVQRISLTDSANKSLIFDKEIDLSNESWSSVLKEYPEKKQKAILALIDTVRKFEVKEYLRNEFSSQFELGDKVLPWIYRLDAEIHLPGGNEDRMQNRTFSFSQRLGGTTQIGGSPDAGVVFAINQNLIDSLFELTFEQNPPDDKSLAEEPLPPPIEQVESETAPLEPSDSSIIAPPQPALKEQKQ